MEEQEVPSSSETQENEVSIWQWLRIDDQSEVGNPPSALRGEGTFLGRQGFRKDIGGGHFPAGLFTGLLPSPSSFHLKSLCSRLHGTSKL